MKIVYVIHCPGEGGMENHVYLLSKYAIQAGHTVDFVFSMTGPLADRVKSLGCKIHYIPMRAPYDPIAVIELVKLFKKIKPDVVHTHFMRENLLVIDASKFVYIPAMFSTIHRLEKKSTFQANVNRLYSKSLTKFIAVSPLAKKYLLEEGIKESKIVSIYNGSEISEVKRHEYRKKLGIGSKEKVIGYVGRFSEEKGHSTLVQAFAKVNDLSTRLVLMGTGDKLEETKKLADKLNVRNRIFFTEVLFLGDRDNTIDLIESCDVYVQPSKIENLPTSVVEAMLLQVPVVASDCDAHKWLLKDGERGHLFKNGSAKDLTKVLDIALNRNKDLVAKTKAAKEYADLHLTATKMWETTEILYEKYAKSDKNVLR